MKKNSPWANVYMALILLLLYLPILVVVLFSFNSNPGRTANFQFEGFSLQWYGELFNPVTGYGAPLRTSLVIALWSVALSAILGTLGAIGLVRDGDRILIDIPQRGINLLVDDAELARRRSEQDARGWKPAEARPRKVTTALKAYALLATSADKGAVRDKALLDG